MCLLRDGTFVLRSQQPLQTRTVKWRHASVDDLCVYVSSNCFRSPLAGWMISLCALPISHRIVPIIAIIPHPSAVCCRLGNPFGSVFGVLLPLPPLPLLHVRAAAHDLTLPIQHLFSVVYFKARLCDRYVF